MSAERARSKQPRQPSCLVNIAAIARQDDFFHVGVQIKHLPYLLCHTVSHQTFQMQRALSLDHHQTVALGIFTIHLFGEGLCRWRCKRRLISLYCVRKRQQEQRDNDQLRAHGSGSRTVIERMPFTGPHDAHGLPEEQNSVYHKQYNHNGQHRQTASIPIVSYPKILRHEYGNAQGDEVEPERPGEGVLSTPMTP